MTIKEPKLEQIKKELGNKKALIECAEQFGVVGDPTRIKICYLLCSYKELSVSNIAQILEISVSAVSHSLSKLKGIDLVDTRRKGQTIFYSLSKSPFNEFLKSQIL